MKRNGISLMEVLASTFVIGVGLLGVLAVIPFGAHQVSKARDAEHCANMLDAAANDLAATGLTQMHTWKTFWDTGETYPNLLPNNSYQTNGTTVVTPVNPYFLNNTNQTDKVYDCRSYLFVDPFDDMMSINISGDSYAIPHVRKVGRGFNNLNLWRERLRGQDDLVYTTHSTKRTNFDAMGGRALSSGKYTWFFMFRPNWNGRSTHPTGTSHWGNAFYDDVDPTATVDLLACYNRMPGDGKTSYARYVNATDPNDDYERYERGARLTIRSNSAAGLDLTGVKYVFVSWANFDGSNYTHADGVWCKIVNIGDIENDSTGVPIPEASAVSTTHKRSIIITGDLPEVIPRPNPLTNSVAIRVLAIPGVVYHKQVKNVPIR